MNPHTATLDEIRDWLAEQDGWELYISSNGFATWHRGGFMPEEGERPYEQRQEHPFPITIDGAAAAMPNGWEWRRDFEVYEGTWRLIWSAFVWKTGVPIVRLADTGDEIADRYRLAALARLAEKEERA